MINGSDKDTAARPKEFFASYLHYTRGTEVPPFFNRWAAIGAIGAWLGRRCWTEFGDAKLYPNLYVMLLGEAGTKKSSAIKRAKKLLAAAGYHKFAAEKTSKEKFLMDLAGMDDVNENDKDVLSTPFGDLEDKEVLIGADEFNDFFGNNVLEFVSMLGVLWDYDGQYKNRIKNGASIVINNPTVSILSGNTQITFANTFPPEVIGQGFFSRTLAVYAEPTGEKITKPRGPTEEETNFMVQYLHAIRGVAAGCMPMTAAADELLDMIYQTWVPLDDLRFKNYSNRRLQHLLKITIIHAAARLSAQIDEQDVRYANTILTHTEHFMPKAYGAFGQAKSAMASYKVLSQIEQAGRPMGITELWATMQGEFDSLHSMADVITALVQAGKVQSIDSKFLPKKKQIVEQMNRLVDYRLLSDDERRNV